MSASKADANVVPLRPREKESPPVGCPECGTVIEDATDRIRTLEADRKNLERDLRGKRSQITKLRNEREERLRKDGRLPAAKEVLDHWCETCSPKAREICSPERLEHVLARLSGGYTVEDLKRCADGYAKRPYVTKTGRTANGTPTQRHVDAELIYRTAKHVQKGLDLADDDSPAPVVGLEFLSWREVQSKNRRLILSSLDARFGGAISDSIGNLLYPCPRCNNDPATTLRVAAPGGSWLVDCSSCGLNETQLLRAIVNAKRRAGEL